MTSFEKGSLLSADQKKVVGSSELARTLTSKSLRIVPTCAMTSQVFSMSGLLLSQLSNCSAKVLA